VVAEVVHQTITQEALAGPADTAQVVAEVVLVYPVVLVLVVVEVMVL
jgi:hypothetical protein